MCTKFSTLLDIEGCTGDCIGEGSQYNRGRYLSVGDSPLRAGRWWLPPLQARRRQQPLAAWPRVGRWRPPLARIALQPTPLRAAIALASWPQPALPAGAAPAGYCPCGLVLAAVWPWVASSVWGLAVVGCPSSSPPSLRKHIKNA
ncbi:hypothetical protein GW17_00012323 [Ensete ventricosum]|nr:hypothetical protein GW17_00012323 [Ensete ventricosum]